MNNKIKVLKVEPNKQPQVVEIKNDISHLQDAVQGYIEALFLNDIILVCNEEGKLLGLESNRYIGFDVICGTFLICAGDGEEFGSLNEQQIEHYTKRFAI